METITIKFYRMTTYTDVKGMMNVKTEVGLLGDEIMMKMEVEIPHFSIVKTILGPFDPEGIIKIQDELRKEEREGIIKNLVFQDEITLNGVRIHISSEQVKMN